MQITHLVAREILDSRANPTIEVDVYLENGMMARAAAPSGASTGSREAVELRDNNPQRYLGKGVQKAVKNVNTEIQTALKGASVSNQRQIDEILIALDNTPNKTRLGANALIAVSLAVAKARALSQKIPVYQAIHTGPYTLPIPMMNIVNGGAHADNGIDMQEFMIIPRSAPNFPESCRYGVEVYHALKSTLKKQGLNTAVGDEGGFAPSVTSHVHAIELILEAIHKAGFKAGEDIALGLDCAASEYYRDGFYHLENRAFSAEQMTDFLADWVRQYPIISIEDPLDESDWSGWAHMTRAFNNKIQLVGDDLFVTNPAILQKGIDSQVANAILIKVNQIGTLTETLDAIQMAKKAGYGTIISHRSGETEDVTIADLCVAVGAGQIKTGAPCRTDRTAKYNQLLRLYEELI